MNLDLDGRRVLITGGSKGIGLACATSYLTGVIIAMDGASSPIVV